MNHEQRSAGEHSEIEAQLKRVRPVAPRLDLEAIVRKSQESQRTSPMPRRTEYSYRAIGVSWIGGALAGAALMYVCLNNPWTAPGNEQATIVEKPSMPAVDLVVEAPRESLEDPQTTNSIEAQEPPPIPAASPATSPTALVFAALSDPRANYPVASLRAGAHFTAFAGDQNAKPTFLQTPSPREQGSDLTPAPAITRGELMRQLQQDKSPWAL